MASPLPDGYLLERDAEVASVGGLGERKGLPKFDYYLDKSDPDVVVLRRQDGAFVAAFSARRTTREGASWRPPRRITKPPCWRECRRKESVRATRAKSLTPQVPEVRSELSLA
jgi:hypothetical protein